MPIEPTTSHGRPIVTHVRIGRGVVKVTRYENEQTKLPSDTASLRSSHSSHSSSTQGPSRNWLRRPRNYKVSDKRTPSAHRSRSRSSGHSLKTVRRVGDYMRSDADLTSVERRPSRDETTSPPARRGQAEPQGLFAPNSLAIPARRGNPAYNRYERPRGRDSNISPLSISPTHTSQSHSDSLPSPSSRSWTTESEVDPAVDQEMWSTIQQLENDLVSKFGRGVVPPLSTLRQEKTSAPAHDSRTRTPSSPEAPRRQPLQPQSQNAKLLQRFHEPITPRQMHRAKSTPTLAFPLPPPTFPDWVSKTPLPMLPQGTPPLVHSLRAKFGPSPPFSPPPKFPPPPPPTPRYEEVDAQRDLDALAALYKVLEASYQPDADDVAKLRAKMGRRTPDDTHARSPRRKVLSCPKPFEGPIERVLEEEEGDVMPSGIVAHAS